MVIGYNLLLLVLLIWFQATIMCCIHGLFVRKMLIYLWQQIALQTSWDVFRLLTLSLFPWCLDVKTIIRMCIVRVGDWWVWFNKCVLIPQLLIQSCPSVAENWPAGVFLVLYKQTFVSHFTSVEIVRYKAQI